ncbi:hypothetical protein SAMN04487770_11011 [Butyrivibrio sp. ob235]|uniref:hypothetical protein n=1 Tax=Butyrivibrio sp. ob235 TaxID=1761780 RepID=UPI0008C967CB|nr:hypothetical protein [Butyrivibrio sp. ob235]SEL41189.1 hypothetical protein SAMN04487770_11011 [Butyrivibrio sp. ob235]
MSWYKEHKQEWKEIIETISREVNRTPQIEIGKKLDELIDDVRDDRMLSKNNPSAQLDYNIPEMLKEIIDSRFYESDYNNITKKLLYEDVSYNEAIQNGIAIIADLDIFNYNK